MKKKVIIIFGPPGSGKGTQAELLETKFGYMHFDTGRFLEQTLRAPGWKKSPTLRRERKNFDEGKLFAPEWVLKIVKDAATRIAQAGLSLIFSGSPRTIYEAFGEKKGEGLIDVLVELFGKKNLFIIKLKVKEQSSMTRNSIRKVCSICGLPVLGHVNTDSCVFCAGPLRRRTLDNPEVIKVRLDEYEKRTKPVLEEMKKRKLQIQEVNGELLPYEVSEKIVKVLGIKDKNT